MSTPSLSNTSRPIPRIYGALSKRYGYLQATVAMELSISEVSNVLAKTPGGFQLESASAVITVTIDTILLSNIL